MKAPGMQTKPSVQNNLIKHEKQMFRTICNQGTAKRIALSKQTVFILDDALHWLSELPENSIHAIITDPPYGLVEYDEKNLVKKQNGTGGVWRMPPSLNGVKRSPIPRFTVLTQAELSNLHDFFTEIAKESLRVLVPGGHVFIASTPLLSTLCFHAFQSSGFEKRGEIIRLVQTLRGGDRPKGAETEFPDITVMPRAGWEPWGLFRKPFPGTVASNLRLWGTGALRRVSNQEPFRDVIQCAPARGNERKITSHPSLKPQRFLRQVVRAALPLGTGIIHDPFAGSGSTLAAAKAIGYTAIGTERDARYFASCREVFQGLSGLHTEP